ncbi:MAG: anti-sigma factor [Rhizobiaceae bacterium]|nr:anti-sigma factor [Rhizobiaceae bacterium]
MAMTSRDESETGKMSSRDELEALLPFYLNGTLDEVDLASVEEWLATDPEALAALEAAELEFSGTTAANEAIKPPADALARFNAALDAEATPSDVAAGAQSLLARLWAGFWAIPASVAWATAAAAIALVLVQTVLGPGNRPGPIEIAGTEQGDLPFALVTFKADARLADVSAFLSEQGASIVSGPAPGGIYRIGIPAQDAADYERIVGLIAAQPFAETVLTGRKPANGG